MRKKFIARAKNHIQGTPEQVVRAQEAAETTMKNFPTARILAKTRGTLSSPSPGGWLYPTASNSSTCALRCCRIIGTLARMRERPSQRERRISIRDCRRKQRWWAGESCKKEIQVTGNSVCRPDEHRSQPAECWGLVLVASPGAVIENIIKRANTAIRGNRFDPLPWRTQIREVPQDCSWMWFAKGWGSAKRCTLGLRAFACRWIQRVSGTKWPPQQRWRRGRFDPHTSLSRNYKSCRHDAPSSIECSLKVHSVSKVLLALEDYNGGESISARAHRRLVLIHHEAEPWIDMNQTVPQPMRPSRKVLSVHQYMEKGSTWSIRRGSTSRVRPQGRAVRGCIR